MTKEVKLFVNDSPIPVDYFVEGFLDRTIGGMMAALEGTGEIKTMELTIDGDAVAVILNGKDVTLNRFVTTIFKSTVTGMVSVLKGVKDTKKVKISIKR